MHHVYRDVDLAFFIPKHITNLPPRKSIIRMIIVVLLSIILCIPFIIGINIESDGYLMWMIQALIITTYATIIIVVINYLIDKEQFKIVLERIKRLVKR